MFLNFNGQLLQEKDLSISFKSRAFAYGDGIFETLIGSKTHIRFLGDHLARLKEGLKAIQLECEYLFTPGKIEKETKDLIEANSIQNLARIRIMIWRKEGGLFSPETNEGEYLINAIEHTPVIHQKQKVVFYDAIRKSLSPISGYKTLSSLNYVMAGLYRKERKADDVILFDNLGNISECLNANVFWIKDEYVFTPSLSTACISGVMRKQIFEKLEQKNVVVIEGKFSPKQILDADFVFTSNIAGLSPMLEIEGQTFSTTHPLFEFLSKELNP